MFLNFFTPRKTLFFRKLVAMAEELQEKLSWVPDTANGMDGIVEFFEICSTYHDQYLKLRKKHKKNLIFKDEKKNKFFRNFEMFLSNTGRQPSGWNRTEIGEPVSSIKILIVIREPFNKHLESRTVAEHLSRRNNPIGEIDHILKAGRSGKWNETGLVENEFVNPFMDRSYRYLTGVLKSYKKIENLKKI
jgi:hypothetical protein